MWFIGFIIAYSVICVKLILTSSSLELVFYEVNFFALSIFILKKAWKSLFGLIKIGVLVTFFLFILLLVLSIWFKKDYLLTFSKFVIIGQYSIFLFLPSVLDNLMYMARHKKSLLDFFESIFQLRNYFLSISRNLKLGFRTSPGFNKVALTKVFLVSERLMSLIPELVIDSLIRSSINELDFMELKNPRNNSILILKFLISIVILIILRLVLYNGIF